MENSRTGWLYEPGDLAGLRARVLDLIGDDAKRGAFAEAAYTSVQGRTWPVLCAELVLHYKAVLHAPFDTQRNIGVNAVPAAARTYAATVGAPKIGLLPRTLATPLSFGSLRRGQNAPGTPMLAPARSTWNGR